MAALLPEGAVVVDEAIMSGLWVPPALAGAPRHDELTLTGGAIGSACRSPRVRRSARRTVLCSAAGGRQRDFTPFRRSGQQAREGLNVTTIVYNNAAYAILRMELQLVGPPGRAQGAAAARPVRPR